MKNSFSASTWTLALALCSKSLAVPTPDVEVAARNAAPVKFIDISDRLTNGTDHVTFERRGGSHEARFCVGYGCSDYYYPVSGFGCGGYCYNGFAANSVYLIQSTTDNPKPTAELYTSSDCTGSHQHAGIWSGYYDGCTNSNSGEVFSAYLYFNC